MSQNGRSRLSRLRTPSRAHKLGPSPKKACEMAQEGRRGTEKILRMLLPRPQLFRTSGCTKAAPLQGVLLPLSDKHERYKERSMPRRNSQGLQSAVRSRPRRTTRGDTRRPAAIGRHTENSATVRRNPAGRRAISVVSTALKAPRKYDFRSCRR